MTDPIREQTGKEIARAAQHAGGDDDPFAAAADPYYEPVFCDLIQQYAEEMEFPEEWAANLGVAERTMFDWIEKFPEFARAYLIALTKLRAAFMRELRTTARRPSMTSNGPLYALIAKKRFADLFGELPQDKAPPLPTAPTDATGAPVIDGTTGEVVEDVAVADTTRLEQELAALRQRN